MNLRLSLVAAAALGILSATAANAADLPEIVQPPATPAYAPNFDWAGAHVGLLVGGVWGTADEGIFGDNTSPTGGFAGANIGYDFTLHNNWILGVEADANFSNASDSSSALFFGGPATYTFEQKLDYFGTVRGRLGYAMGSNLFYGTGGWAWGHGTRTVSFPFGIGTFSDKQSLSGWTIGAGVEHVFTPNVIGRLQYLYTDYGTTNFNIAGTPIPVSITTSTLSMGINLKF